MNKPLKALAVLLLLLVAAPTLVALVVDPNDYKDDIKDGFTAATGYELVIAGPLRIDLFPEPVLEITQASLPGALGDQGPPLAEIDRLRLYPRWAPLLAGRLKLALVRAQGMRLHLIRDGQGRASWTAGETPPLPWRVSHRPSRSPGPFDVLAAETAPIADWPAIDRVELLDARITWEDHRSGQRLALEGLEILASPVVPGRPIALRLTGAMRVGNQGRPAALHATGQLRVGADPWPVRLEPLTARLQGLDLGSGLAAELLLRTGVAANPDAGRYLAAQATLESQVSGAALSPGRLEARVNARLELDLTAEHLRVTGLAVRSGTLSASGELMGQRLGSAPAFSGGLKVAEFDPRAWLAQQQLPLPRTADDQALRRFSLALDWRFEDGRFAVPDLALGLDQTWITGKVESVATNPQGYRFDLVADRLDLDRYLPPTGSGSPRPEPSPRPVPATKAPATSAPPSTAPGQGTGPVAAAPDRPPAAAPPATPARPPATAGPLAYPDLQGRLRIGALTLARLHFEDTHLELRLEDGNLYIDDQVRRFYGGSLAGRLGLDLRGAEPRVTLVQHGQEIQLGPLIADRPWGDRLSGHGEIDADLVATGRDTEALRRSLTGTLAVRIPRGAIKGINLERLVREAKARLRGEAQPRNLSSQTDFKDLCATAELRDGILTNRDLTATADRLRITGDGTLDLVRGQIDYRFRPMFIESPRGRSLEGLEGLAIPVQLTGPLDHPRWSLDLEDVLSAAAKRRLGEQGGDLLQRLEKHIDTKGLEQRLKGLFGR